MATVEFRLTARKRATLDHEVHIGNYVLRELRALGVPVIGALFPQSVRNGVLRIQPDDPLVSADTIFTWEGEPEPEDDIS